MAQEAINRSVNEAHVRESLGAFLYRLASEQSDALDDSQKVSILSTRKELIKGFGLSHAFTDGYQEAVRFHLMPHSPQEMRGFLKYFVGAEFQGIALNSTPELTLLPDNVLRFYRKMYPHIPVVEHPLGLTSLMGISVPDGLGISIDQPGKASVTNVYECSLTNRVDGYERHYKGFLIRRREFPDIFKDSQLVFITPKESQLPSDIKKDPNVRVVELAISRKQFSDYIDGLYGFYRPGFDGPTLVEIQDWARHQLTRAQDYLGSEQLTPEYVDYLIKVGLLSLVS